MNANALLRSADSLWKSTAHLYEVKTCPDDFPSLQCLTIPKGSGKKGFLGCLETTTTDLFLVNLESVPILHFELKPT